MAPSRDDGLLAGPLDIDAPRGRGLERTELFVTRGTELTHRPTGTRGAVVELVEGRRVTLRDGSGRDHDFRPVDGMFLHDGRPVALRSPRAASPDRSPPRRVTASGSIDAGPLPARVARPSRLWVEGVHDAELIERIWGDDLRVEGVVVEPLDGADDLAERVRGFRPGDGRRLGVLLDHLVEGSKESRIAASVDDRNVLICGHPYIDVWAAIRPSVVGIEAWPDVAHGIPWKAGVLAALGIDDEPGRFWKQVLGRVSSYRDVETPLVNAVERLIDFVTT